MRRHFVACLLAVSCMPATVDASPYIDDLSRCLVDKSTPAERVKLVQWLFVVESRHPAVAATVQIPQEAVDRSNKDVAEIFTRLVASACPEQARKAYQLDGATAFQQSFKALGELAGAELFADPKVRAATAGIGKYIDADKFGTMFRP